MKIKRFLSFLLCTAISFTCFAVFFGCGADRDEILRIYVPGEYIDSDIYEGFAEFYKAQTGKNITVSETTFDTNESMVLKIEKSHEDYDLACPSDYMIEYMREKNLLLKLNEGVEDRFKIDITVGDADSNGQPLIKQTYIDVTKKFDPELEYTVPYMYGTFGIMYDYSKTKRHIDSWEYMFFEDDKELGRSFNKKLTQKESVREMYVSACIYAERKKLSEMSNGFTDYGADYNDAIQEIFEDTSVSTINSAKRLLLNQKKYVLKYESDDGKFGIAGGTLNAVGGLYWSCDAGYVMADYEDDGGNEFEGNKNLWYVIPKEGGNVYIDGFVIPKYAGNRIAANLFLQYICRKDIAISNSIAAGVISPVSSAYDSLYEEYDSDDEMYEGTEEGWKEMYLDMLFPCEETLKRCGVMKNFKNNNSKINLMFADVVG